AGAVRRTRCLIASDDVDPTGFGVAFSCSPDDRRIPSLEATGRRRRRHAGAPPAPPRRLAACDTPGLRTSSTVRRHPGRGVGEKAVPACPTTLHRPPRGAPAREVCW